MKHLPRKLLSLAMALVTLSAPAMSPQLSSFTGSITADAAAEYDNDTKTISDTDKTITYKRKKDCTWEEGAIASSVTLKSGKDTVVISSSITLQKSDKTKVTVPVTDIADNFAKSLKALKTLTIPASIKTIGHHVAYECVNLATVNFYTKQVEHLDSTFLNGPIADKKKVPATHNCSLYYKNRYYNDTDKNGGHVCVGEWLLKYNEKATQTTVTVNKLSKNGIKKIAVKAFTNCSPKLKTVDLAEITHIDSYGLGMIQSGLSDTFYPTYDAVTPNGTVVPYTCNNIEFLENTNKLIYADTSSLTDTLYFAKEYSAHNYDKNYYPMFLGGVLYKIIPGTNTGQTKLDLSADKYKNIKFISCSLNNDKYTFTQIILPKNFEKFTVTMVRRTTICDMSKISSFKYFNGSSYVELKDVIKNRVMNGTKTKLSDKDIKFIQNNFMNLTGGERTDTSLAATKGYIKTLAEPLAIQFLENKCLVNPNVKPTDAWAQYNVIRKVACGIRDNFEYHLYRDKGSGNAATGFVRCMTGLTTDRNGFVCRDYADLFEYLMRFMGITAYKVTSSGHEWNTVRIYDTKDKKEHWFNIDTTGTWNTGTITFMSSDADIQYKNSSHVRKKREDYGTQDVTVPKCTEGRGDVTRNGIVDDADIDKVMNAYTKELSGYASPLSAYEKVLADVDCNGLVDSADAQLLLQYYTETLCCSFSANPKASDYKSLEKYLYDYFHKVNEKLNEADKHKFPSWNDAEKAKLK